MNIASDFILTLFRSSFFTFSPAVFLSVILVFLTSHLSLKSQIDDTLEVPYELGFDFNEGVYLTFDEFRNNRPSLKIKIEGRGSDLYVWNDSLQEMTTVNPQRVWGYSQAGNIYIAIEDAFWRIINIGQLSQFSAIVVSRFMTTDAFGFPVEQYSKNMQQLFMDMNDGSIYELNAKNLKFYLEQEPMLDSKFSKLKRKKPRELILILKAYNELHPIYFPVYE